MSKKPYIDYKYSTKEFEERYTYEGNDLGVRWKNNRTNFRVWSPVAQACHVVLFREGDINSKEVIGRIPMVKAEKGTWKVEVPENLEGIYYNYEVTINGITNLVCDPYAKAVGVNGKRAMVLNMESCNPKGWEEDTNPNKGFTINDTVIYEMSIRDFSSDQSSGIQEKGSYLGVTESGTTNSYGQKTGIDYLIDLGITHVHLLPIYDFGSIDERERNESYNWGYDPMNYNVPEGSYSTNPFDGAVRVKELKKMIQTLHNNGISVVMDVVYNHVYEADLFSINQLVPGYFSRIDEQGEYSNGSYCGNDTASERSMVHKYLVDSVLYWMEEYHIDGFRFDLVGLLDTSVINDIVERVHRKRPDVIFYGEGWNMPTRMTKENYKMAIQMNAQITPSFAYFNDQIRDLLKGNYARETEKGYVNGALGNMEALKANIMGLPYWSPNPSQTVQYVSCHDDFGIFDRLQISTPEANVETLAAYNQLAAAIIFLSQGIPFIHGGEEFLRSKQDETGKLISNSYNASDLVNSIKWDTLNIPVNAGVKDYYKGLIAFRKAHPSLRLQTAYEVRNILRFVGDFSGQTIAYKLDAKEVPGESLSEIIIIFHPEQTPCNIPLPEGEWNVYIHANEASKTPLTTVNNSVIIPPISTLVLGK